MMNWSQNDSPHGGLIVRLYAVGSMLLGTVISITLPAQVAPPLHFSVDWSKTVVRSKTAPTLMMEVHPLLRTGHPLHDAAFSAIRELGAQYVRYHAQSFWPRLVVAELEQPTKDKTSWDFSKIDSIVIPFLEATKGHEPVLNFNTIPAWMFKTDKPVHYPDNPDQFIQSYAQGTELVDPSGHQLADYYARVVSWYTQGGFTDELGHYHASGYHYDLPWWEVLNEVQLEHQMTPQEYVTCYDAIVAAVHKVSPRTKFIGLALASMGASGSAREPAFFEYFLNPKNHRPGIPLDMIAYHFYAIPSLVQTLDSWQYSFFDQADGFLNTVALIESIRQRLSPATRVDLDELGIILPEYFLPRAEGKAIPPAYWNLSATLFAYLYVELAKQGIDVVATSQFLGDPKDNPGVVDPMGIDPNDSIPLIDWKSGKPNARFCVLKLLNDNFGLGDRLVSTQFDTVRGSDVEMQGSVTAKGKKLLVIDKRATAVDISVGAVGRIRQVEVVDVDTGDHPPRTDQFSGEMLHLEPFAVAVARVED